MLCPQLAWLFFGTVRHWLVRACAQWVSEWRKPGEAAKADAEWPFFPQKKWLTWNCLWGDREEEKCEGHWGCESGRRRLLLHSTRTTHCSLNCRLSALLSALYTAAAAATNLPSPSALRPLSKSQFYKSSLVHLFAFFSLIYPNSSSLFCLHFYPFSFLPNWWSPETAKGALEIVRSESDCQVGCVCVVCCGALEVPSAPMLTEWQRWIKSLAEFVFLSLWSASQLSYNGHRHYLQAIFLATIKTAWSDRWNQWLSSVYLDLHTTITVFKLW